MEFVWHHAKRCNLEPGGACRDADRQAFDASNELIGGWASGLLASRPFPEKCRSAVAAAWNDLIAPFDNQTQWGTVAADDALSPILGRALLSAVARRNAAERDAISQQFRSRTAAVDALRRIVASSFQVDPSELHAPLEESELTAALEEAAERSQ